MNKKRLYAVVPAFNEEIDIPLWLDSLCRSKWRGRFEKLIIVNDGSTDRTLDKIKLFKKKLPIQVISYEENRGPGYAFRLGLKMALKISEEDAMIVTMECDNTSDLKILPKMIEKIREGADVCVASYYTKGGGVSNANWWRSIISQCGNWVIRMGCDIKDVKTFSSFYRVYRSGALDELYQETGGELFVENGFAHAIEVLSRLFRLGMKLTEVPFFLVNGNRRGESHMRILQTAMGYFRVVFYYRLYFRSWYFHPRKNNEA